MKYYVLITAMMMAANSVGLAGESDVFKKAREQRRAFRDEFMEKVLAEPGKGHPVVYAMSGLYTGKDLVGANRKLRETLAQFAGPDKKMSVEEATDVKWRMRGWLRIYYLFNAKSDFFPGRLDADVQAKMEEMFFLYGCGKSTVERAQLSNIWHIQGSENHDMMDLSNAYLSLQAVQNLDAYKDRKLPDGQIPAAHVKAWHAYYAQYCLERAKNGLFVEISPTYGKWFVGELVNMYDFTEDPLVKKQMEMLLHLAWADWSIDQLNGTRGGSKTRCYKDYAQRGSNDSWDLMARDLMGIQGWFWNSHGILSTMALSTSRYELPDVVLDIALNKGDFTPLVYESMRPAKQVESKGEVYVMDPKGGGIVRYSYCTPESIMGSWMLDTRADYAAINNQNRWQGVIFATGPEMRVYPDSVGLGNGKTYNQHVAVQHRNVMLVANHPKAKQTGQIRVYFNKGFRERIVEKDGWVIVKEGKAWLGVKVLSENGDATARNYDIKEDNPKTGKANGFWLWPKADRPPVALVVSRESTHKTLDDFLAYLGSHEYGSADGRATYSFEDDLGAKKCLELGGDLPIPRIDGKPVNLYPEKVFDSPYLNSVHGSGVVTIQKGARKKVLDFTFGTDAHTIVP